MTFWKPLVAGALWASLLGVSSDAIADPRFGVGKSHLTVVAGRGAAMGRSDGSPDVEDVTYVPIALGLGVGITDPLGGDSWYRGNLELRAEGTLLAETQPSRGTAAGGSVLLRYNWLRFGSVVPFLDAGAGLLDLDLDLTSQSDGLSFLLEAGVGSHLQLSRRAALTAEWRFQHISNADLRYPNGGINASAFLLGATLFLEPLRERRADAE